MEHLDAVSNLLTYSGIFETDHCLSCPLVVVLARSWFRPLSLWHFVDQLSSTSVFLCQFFSQLEVSYPPNFDCFGPCLPELACVLVFVRAAFIISVFV